MDMMVAMGLVRVLKTNKTLYNKVDVVFESGVVDEAVCKELVEEAKMQGITLELENLLDDLDELLRNGMNGISVKAMGGLSGIMSMAEGFVD